MTTLTRPVLHYDRMLGAHPHWRKLVMGTFEGKWKPYRAEVALLEAGGFRAGALTLSALVAYAQAGQQVYCVGPKLQRLFHETDLSSVPEAFLRLPYNCVYVALPDSPWSIWGGTRTGWHPVTGAYILQTHHVITMILWGQENEKSDHVGDDATFWIAINLNKCPSSGDEATRVVDIESQISSQMSTYTADDSDPGMRAEDPVVRRKTVEVTQSVARVCFNLLLYLNSAAPEVTVIHEGGPTKAKREKLKKEARRKRGKKGARARKKIKDLTEARIVWIGQSIEKRGSRGPDQGPRVKTARTPHWRKGHFQAYWVGSRKDAEGNPRKGSHQVLKWIAPVFVGNMADMIRARGTIHMFREDKGDA